MTDKRREIYEEMLLVRERIAFVELEIICDYDSNTKSIDRRKNFFSQQRTRARERRPSEETLEILEQVIKKFGKEIAIYRESMPEIEKNNPRVQRRLNYVGGLIYNHRV